MNVSAVAEPWQCHARPATLGGKTCGHYNATGGIAHGVNRLTCCESCGATKKASDDRKRREEERTSGR